MIQVNISKAKDNLSKLIHMLEDGMADNIIISRNGVPVVQMVQIPKPKKKSIIGAAKGEFNCPDDIYQYDNEISKLFEQK